MDFSRVADELRDYPADGRLQLMDLMALTESSRVLLTWIVRQGRITARSCQRFTKLPLPAVGEIIRILLERGFLVEGSGEEGEQSYQLRIVSRTRAATLLDDW